MKYIASNSLGEVEALAEEYSEIQYRVVDMNNQNTFAHLIADSDVVIRQVFKRHRTPHKLTPI